MWKEEEEWCQKLRIIERFDSFKSSAGKWISYSYPIGIPQGDCDDEILSVSQQFNGL